MSRATRARAATARIAGKADPEQSILTEALSFMSAHSGTNASRIIERLYFALIARRRRDLPADLPALTQDAIAAAARRRSEQLAADTGRPSGRILAPSEQYADLADQRTAARSDVTAAHEIAITTERTQSGSSEYQVPAYLDLAAAALRAAEVCTETQGLERMHG